MVSEVLTLSDEYFSGFLCLRWDERVFDVFVEAEADETEVVGAVFCVEMGRFKSSRLLIIIFDNSQVSFSLLFCDFQSFQVDSVPCSFGVYVHAPTTDHLHVEMYHV